MLTFADDTQMAIALSRSLIALGRCDAEGAAMAYANEFQPHRGYGGSAVKVGGEKQATSSPKP